MIHRSENMLQLLHALGHIYDNHGQSKRALVFQLIASRLQPDNRHILRSLACTFLNDGAADKALSVIFRLRALGETDPVLDLLQGRALWRMGSHVEARHMFQQFVERRREGDV